MTCGKHPMYHSALHRPRRIWHQFVHYGEMKAWWIVAHDQTINNVREKCLLPLRYTITETDLGKSSFGDDEEEKGIARIQPPSISVTSAILVSGDRGHLQCFVLHLDRTKLVRKAIGHRSWVKIDMD